MKFATRYAPPPSVGLEFVEPSMTEQQFKDECDINNIIAKFDATGVMPSGTRQPMFGDFDKFPQDLMSSRKMFDEANERFMQLPAALRKQFDNDPTKLLGWLQDPANRESAVKFGLLEDVPQPQPQAQSQPQAQNAQPESTNVS